MNKFIEQTAAKIAKNPKPYVYGAGACILLLLGVVIVRRIRRGKKFFSIGDMTGELGGLSNKNLTLSHSQAIVISQNLLNAMDRIGTDDQAIYDNLLKAKTTDDLHLIIQKFGIKLYDGWGLADTFLSKHIGSTMKNLNGWLRSELSGRKLTKVKEIFDNLEVPL